MSESNHPGGGLGTMSGYEDLEGAAGYSSAVDYNNELEVQERIKHYEQKMMRATLNRSNKLQECQGKLQY